MKLYDISNPEGRVIPRVLDFQAENSPDATWLWTDDRKVSFREAAEMTRRYASGLHALGLGRGMTLTTVMEPSIDLVLVALGASRLGAIFTTINTDYRGSFLQDAITQSLATVLVIDEALADRLEGLDLGAVRAVFVNGSPDAAPAKAGAKPLASLAHETPELPQVELNWLDPVQVWWSSGTTGKSKGVMHSHSSILHLSHNTAALRSAPGDVFYACTPMYLGSAWTGSVWPSLVSGTCAAIDAKFSASQFWTRIRKYGATHFFTLGSMHMHLWKAPPHELDAQSGVRYGQAIPLSWEMIPQFKERFGIQHMNQAYGTSETFMVFQALDDGTPWTGAAMGRPVPHLDVKLMNEIDQEVPVGEAGEICVRPKEPGVMFLGYFNAPEITVAAWRNLWHHTGDMAMRDEDGVYYFADRKKDYIRYNGRNISMFEVEAVVDRHPDLADVAAYGTQSETLESEAELTLCVVPKPGKRPTPEEIATFINANAPYYFVPRYIEFASELPRNAHGRIMKHILRDRGLLPDAWDRKKAGFVPTR